MDTFETLIAKKILDVLHDEDGRQMHALSIHGSIGGTATCNVTTFDNVMTQLEERKFVLSVKTKFKGVLWNISDAGEAARLEMA